MERHEIPTHLGVEDRAFAGLTMRQLMTLGVGLALAYSAGNDLPVPTALRLALAGAVAVLSLVLALCRPGGRALDDWAFVLLRYCALPRLGVWRSGSCEGAPLVVSARHEVILPAPAWLEGR